MSAQQQSSGKIIAWISGLALIMGLISSTTGVWDRFFGSNEAVRSVLQSETVSDKGVCPLNEFGVHEVNYSQPFAEPPNLVLAEGKNVPENFSLIEQRTDGFRYEVKYTFNATASQIPWKATGKRKGS